MLSVLQLYILTELFATRRLPPNHFLKFYSKKQTPPKKADQHSSISRSIERLIERGLCVARGRRTREKWFIDEVKLTPAGRRRARTALREKQLSLLSR